MKPDYGSQLLLEGVTSEVDLVLYGHTIFSIDVLGPGQYSTMADREHRGMWYAMSLDFGQEHLERILTLAPQNLAHRIRTELSRSKGTPRSIDLPEPMRVDLRARIGRPQTAAEEVFVPLVCQEILTHTAPRPMALSVSRSDVERVRTEDCLGVIRRWIESSKNPVTLLGQLQIAFSGYDADPRELWEVPEVRRFVQAIDEEFPFWFYFADLSSELLRVMAFCMCASSRVGRGSTAISSQDFAAFLERHFGAMNQIMDHWHVNDAVNQRRTQKILSYFERSQILN